MNKYPYIATGGTFKGSTPPPGSKPTGWAFSDAIIQRSCPKCGCSAGFYCESPAGKSIWPPHSARVVVGEEHRAKAVLAADLHDFLKSTAPAQSIAGTKNAENSN